MKNERNKSNITECLYETDSMIFEFTARVLECIEKPENEARKRFGIILDRTAFFPEGGGQQADEGLIEDAVISDVQTDPDGRIIHYSSSAVLPGSPVTGKIDRDIRFTRMQNHSAEHIVSGIIHSMFGYNNTGFHMMEAGVRLDCDGVLTGDQIREVEKRANEAVFRNVPVTVSFPSKEEAEQMDYRSKLDIEEGIRIVTIEGVDVCACCAPHVTTTGQIGIIRIIDAMPHRGGMRITMLAGWDAYEDYLLLEDNNTRIMNLLSAKRGDTAEFAGDFYNRNQKLKEENTFLRKELAGFVTEGILKDMEGREAENHEPVVIFTEILDQVGLRNLINECTKKYAVIVAGFIGNDSSGYRYVIGNGTGCDLKNLCKSFNSRFGASGGGSNDMVSGSVMAASDSIRDFFDDI